MLRLWGCFSDKNDDAEKTKRPSSAHNRLLQSVQGRSPLGSSSTRRKRGTQLRSWREKIASFVMEKHIRAAILLQHSRSRGLMPPSFHRSSSLRCATNTPPARNTAFSRSSSSRTRSISDPRLQPHQFLNQNLNVDEVETKDFVLIHGGGFGAWCWYKTMALLQDGGFHATAIDLTGSGVDSCNTANITTLAQYVDPLLEFLQKLGEGAKVILVGHDFGGICISYAMEAFPSKISKAVFVCAAMPTTGQSAWDLFSQQGSCGSLMGRARRFLYTNGSDHPPTGIELDKSQRRELFFNQSPHRDAVLASLSMRPIPFAPVLEKLCVSNHKYGSVRRFYIETPEDNAIPLPLQQNLIKMNPPERVFRLKGADHSPFFSKPRALHKHLVEIANIPALPAG